MQTDLLSEHNQIDCPARGTAAAPVGAAAGGGGGGGAAAAAGGGGGVAACWWRWRWRRWRGGGFTALTTIFIDLISLPLFFHQARR